VFWLNADKITGAWKLHKDSYRFCNPVESKLKGVNQMKKNGGWFKFESYPSAYTFFQKEHEQRARTSEYNELLIVSLLSYLRSLQWVTLGFSDYS
jgi:hypothetical protein